MDSLPYDAASTPSAPGSPNPAAPADGSASQNQSQAPSQAQSHLTSQSRVGSLAKPATASQPNHVSETAAANAKRRRQLTNLSDCCRTCRLRKVKCSGNPGTGPCTNCARLELTCGFTADSAEPESLDRLSRTTPSHVHTEAGTPRRRAQRACRLCHAHKTKCSGDVPQCKRCAANGFSCEYMTPKRKFANITSVAEAQPSVPDTKSESTPDPSVGSDDYVSPPQTHSSDSVPPMSVGVTNMNAENLLARKDILIRHMDVYMEVVYPVPCMTFLHPETSYRQIADGTMHPARAAGICAVSSFFVNSSESGREFGMRCADQVEFYLFRNLHKLTEEALYLYALNLSYFFLAGSFAKVWQCFGLAARLMMGLQINWESFPPGKTFTQKECLRRVAWHFFFLDRALAGGYDEYLLCHLEHMKLPLPCTEAAYRESREVQADKLKDRGPTFGPGTGMQGFCLCVIEIRHRIQANMRRIASATIVQKQRLEPSRVMREIKGFQEELIRLHRALPSDVRLSDQSIARFTHSQERSTFVFLHSHFLVCYLDLYKFALPGSRERPALTLPPEFLAQSQKQAVSHAICLGRFCLKLQQEVDRQPNTGKLNLAGDPTIGHMVTQCLRVLLISMQHDLYQDLAEHNTAPFWGDQPADEPQIWALIESLFRINEPLSSILGLARQAHLSNLAMVEQFRKTRELDYKQLSYVPHFRPCPSGSLPGPGFIIGNAKLSTQEQEQRTRAGDAAAAQKWFQRTSSPADPSSYALGDTTRESAFDPPGVPMLLSGAQVVPEVTDNRFGLTDMMGAMLLRSTEKIWAMPDFGGLMDDADLTSQLSPQANEISPVALNHAPDLTGFPPVPPPPPQPLQHPFVSPESNMYIEGDSGFGGHYQSRASHDQSGYLSRTNFGP